MRLALCWLLALVCLLAPGAARAAEAPVIAAGREAEIVALVSPYFGAEKDLTPGHRLGDVEVKPHFIRFTVNGNGAKGAIRLEHPEGAPPGVERTPSFAVYFEGAASAEMTAALRALTQVVRGNDKGEFWPLTGPRPGSEQLPSRFARGRAHWLTRLTVPRPLRDGVLLFAAAAALTVVHLRRVLRAEPRRVLFALLGLVALGAALRLTLSRETIMNVWPYNREVPLARLAFDGVVLPAIAGALRARVYLTDVIFKTTALLAIVTPLVFFAHARYVLRDTRGALFAAALLVLLPNHIRFSRADSEFIQSLATSSLTFVVLYTALRDRSRAFRAVCFAALPLLSVATYFVRPENLFFYLVDVGAIWLTSGDEAPRRRKLIAFAEVTLAAAFAFVVHLLAQYESAVRAGLSLHTLRTAVALFFDLQLNTLINVSITPPGLTLLAIAGAVLLVRRGERGRALFLTSWLLGFFVVHSFVRPSQPAMQARYHLHLITPLLLLAASALPEVLRLRRSYIAAGALYFAASPLLHHRFIRDTDYNEMREFDFLRAASRAIPEGCTVLELSPALGTEPDPVLASRLDRLSIVLDGRAVRRVYEVVNFGRLGPAQGSEERAEVLSVEARALLARPPPCLMIYEGLTCRSHRPGGVERAPVCDAVLRAVPLTVVASAATRSRLYDEVLAGRVVPFSNGDTRCVPRLSPGETIPFTLYSMANSPTSISPGGSGSHDALGRDGSLRLATGRSVWRDSNCWQSGAPSGEAQSELR